MEQEIENIEYICKTIETDNIPITDIEVESAIKKLKKNKAKDAEDMVAEHLINGGKPVSSFICKIINAIIQTKKMPLKMKTGLLHPIHKRGKEINLPGNFRGITIVFIICKVLDIIKCTHQKVVIPEDRLDVQFGFTPERSPSHATLLVNEAIIEAKEQNLPLFIATLDIQKAFDVVPHHLLLRKLFNDGMKGTWWLLKKESYKELCSKVIWKGEKGDPFNILQGIIQGGVGSTSDFKVSLHDGLQQMSSSDVGVHIGEANIGILACADDVIFMSHSENEMHQLIMFFNFYTNRERFIIHPTKSTISVFNTSNCEKKFYVNNKPWKINEKNIPVTEEFVHLGVKYNLEKASSTASVTVEERLKSGRSVTYAMMGAGMHGVNGVNPIVTNHIYKTVAESKVVYSLEYLNIGTTLMKKLTAGQNEVLRNIQTLPQRTATSSLYILLGTLPVQATIEQRQLSCIPSIAKNDTIFEVMINQIAMKKMNSNSWFIIVEKLLLKYGLPKLLEVVEKEFEKEKWKEIVKKAVFEYWKKQIEVEATEKTSLKYMNIHFSKSPHIIWSTTSHDVRDVRRANIKVRMLTGTYILQANRKAFNQTKNSTCPLCGKEDEDMIHFITECDKLENVRFSLMKIFIKLVPYVYINHPSIWSRQMITQLILDPSHDSITEILPLNDATIQRLEKWSRILLYKIHLKIIELLEKLGDDDD